MVSYLHGAAAVRRLRAESMQQGVSRLSGDCANPLLFGCGECGHLEVWACRNHRESRCPPCAARYRRRVQRIADYGLTAGAARGWHLYLLTVTAPSQGPHRRWIPGVRGDHGQCECWVEDLASWNASQSKFWNRLRTRLVRLDPSLKYLRAVEVQDGKRGGEGRGALHLHVPIVCRKPLDEREVQNAAMAAGFGCVMVLDRLDPGSRKAARYVSKYVGKATDSRAIVPWHRERVDRTTGEITVDRRPTFRTWSSSRSWGLTMRECVEASRRAVQRHQRQQQQQQEGCGQAAGASGPEVAAGGQPPPPPT